VRAGTVADRDLNAPPRLPLAEPARVACTSALGSAVAKVTVWQRTRREPVQTERARTKERLPGPHLFRPFRAGHEHENPDRANRI